MNPYQFYRMLMKPENRKISKMVLGVLLTVSLLLPYVTVFILNNFVEADTEIQYEAVLNQNADPITKWEEGQTVVRRINVSNRPEGTTEGYGNVYARVQLREYLETGTANVTKSEERLLVGSDGKFLSYATEEEAKEAYPNREVKDYTAVGETAAKWYVVAGDGITGQYLSTSVSVSSPTKVPNSATKGTPSSYAVHKWANQSADTTLIGEYVDLGIRPNPAAVAFKDAEAGSTVAHGGRNWIVVKVSGSNKLIITQDNQAPTSQFRTEIPYAPGYSGSVLDGRMQSFYDTLDKDLQDIAMWVDIPAETAPTDWQSTKVSTPKATSPNTGTSRTTSKTCFALSYAEANAWSGRNNSTGWWLRSAGGGPSGAVLVNSSGILNYFTVTDSLGVRPALWINPTPSVQDMSDWDGKATSSWILDTESEEGWAYWGQPLEPGQTTGDLLSTVTLKSKPEGAFYYAVNGKLEMTSGDSLTTNWSDVPTKVKGTVTVTGETSVLADTTQEYTATVTGVTSSKAVTWSVTGGVSGTTIDSTGKLTVSASEAVGTVLTVTATSMDGVAVGTATVTVASPEPSWYAEFRSAGVGSTVSDGTYTWLVIKVSGSNKLIITTTMQGTTQFHASSNVYSSSLLASSMATFYSGLSNDMKNIAQLVTIPTNGTSDSTPGSGTKTCFALSINEANLMTTAQRNLGSYWWLRSPGSSGSNFVAFVYFDGNVNTTGRGVVNPYGVRPALWINL